MVVSLNSKLESNKEEEEDDEEEAGVGAVAARAQALGAPPRYDHRRPGILFI